MKLQKKLDRQERNKQRKQAKAAQTKANFAMLGRLVFEREVPTGEVVDGVAVTEKVLDFPPAIRTSKDGSILPLPEPKYPNYPHAAVFASSSFPRGVAPKTFPLSGLSMKNRPGNKELHGEAIVEDASRTFANEVAKAMTPEETPVPVVPEGLAGEVAQL